MFTLRYEHTVCRTYPKLDNITLHCSNAPYEQYAICNTYMYMGLLHHRENNCIYYKCRTLLCIPLRRQRSAIWHRPNTNFSPHMHFAQRVRTVPNRLSSSKIWSVLTVQTATARKNAAKQFVLLFHVEGLSATNLYTNEWLRVSDECNKQCANEQTNGRFHHM